MSENFKKILLEKVCLKFLLWMMSRISSHSVVVKSSFHYCQPCRYHLFFVIFYLFLLSFTVEYYQDPEKGKNLFHYISTLSNCIANWLNFFLLPSAISIFIQRIENDKKIYSNFIVAWTINLYSSGTSVESAK